MRTSRTDQTGFTLIELLVVVVIIAILFTFGLLSLGPAQSATSSNTTIDTFLADLKGQQLLAMAGGQGGGTTAQPYGLHIESASYTLFAGSSYSSGNSTNFTVNAGDSVSLSTTLPSAQVIFNKGDGSVAGFVNGSNTVTITAPGSTHTVTINRFGATTVN